MDAHGAHCDTTVRVNYLLALESLTAYNGATQRADVNVQQITQIIDVVPITIAINMPLSPLI